MAHVGPVQNFRIGISNQVLSSMGWVVQKGGRGGGLVSALTGKAPPPLCDIPSSCCCFTGPWTVTHSSLRMLRRVAGFCQPLRPVLLLVSFPRLRSPVVGVLGRC